MQEYETEESKEVLKLIFEHRKTDKKVMCVHRCTDIHMAFFNRQAFGRSCQWQVLQILKYSILFQENAYLKVNHRCQKG